MRTIWTCVLLVALALCGCAVPGVDNTNRDRHPFGDPPDSRAAGTNGTISDLRLEISNAAPKTIADLRSQISKGTWPPVKSVGASERGSVAEGRSAGEVLIPTQGLYDASFSNAWSGIQRSEDLVHWRLIASNYFGLPVANGADLDVAGGGVASFFRAVKQDGYLP